jgi:hypothetical protein
VLRRVSIRGGQQRVRHLGLMMLRQAEKRTVNGHPAFLVGIPPARDVGAIIRAR